MANPQKEHGFTAIANEIMDKLCKLNLSDYECRVIHVIFRKTYGWGKKSDIISLNQFSMMTNIKTQHVARTIKELLQRQIISVKYLTPQSVEYSFQKNYDLWDKRTLLDDIFNKQLLPSEVVPEQVVPSEVVPEQVVPSEDTGSPCSGSQVVPSEVVPSQVDTIAMVTKSILQKQITITKDMDFNLPEWIKLETWNAFMETRAKLKATPTKHAKELLIKELEKFRILGCDPDDVLNQSIMNGWKGVFLIKNNGHKPVKSMQDDSVGGITISHGEEADRESNV
jgi:phage replication O-like protein O